MLLNTKPQIQCHLLPNNQVQIYILTYTARESKNYKSGNFILRLVETTYITKINKKVEATVKGRIDSSVYLFYMARI